MDSTQKSANSQALNHALALAKLGWSVVPLIPQGKRPLVQWKELQKRPLSEREIAEQFEQNPNSNLGVVTGQVSKLLVLDCDAPDALRRMGQGVPETPMVETARGHHFYFSLPNVKIKSMTIADGLEVKAQGSLVVAPPSTHPSGAQYRWLIPPPCFEWGAEPAPPPAWLMELIYKHRARKRVNLTSAVHGVNEGVRNRSTAAIAGKLLGALPPNDWAAIAWPLVCAWNTQNKPPLSARELRQVFDKIAQRELKTRQKISKEARAIKALYLLNKHLQFSLRELSKITQIPHQTLSRWLAAATHPPKGPPLTAPLWGNGTVRRPNSRTEANFFSKVSHCACNDDTFVNSAAKAHRIWVGRGKQRKQFRSERTHQRIQEAA